ncbi:MAG: SIS domain-containing protein [Candidatus Scalindua sp.]|jgi:D-sedoheptulose 7-phosphate isomerase|nr:SIS domain-containing protein [Candidatus Scalindua sp.]
MNGYAKDYYNCLVGLMSSVVFTSSERNNIDFYDGIEKVCNLIMTQVNSGNKLMFIGNGASAAISSHMSTDFWKTCGIRAIAFNDSSLLTCLGNDFGYEYIFEKSIEMFADPGDILVAISSSGKSENILRGVNSAKLKECSVITLSGFKDDNPLSSAGDFNFYVPVQEYGTVEVIHHSICHCILDTIVNYKDGIGK